jgi:hypothetical protein
MNFVHCTLYLAAEHACADTEWGVDVYTTREKALTGVSHYLTKSGLSTAEAEIAIAELKRDNRLTVPSLGLQVNLMMAEVQ